MRRIVSFLFLLLIIYFAKPIWEEPVSRYVDLSFLDPVDEKVNEVLTSEPVTTTVGAVRETIDAALVTILGDTAKGQIQLTDAKKPLLTKPVNAAFSIHNIELGASKEKVKAELGDPVTVTRNEYGTDWYTYHQNYQNFVMVSFDDKGTVNALYTNNDLISSTADITYGSPKKKVRETFGEPITELRKGLNIFILQETEGFDLFRTDDSYVYVFYDLHEGDTVTAIQLIRKDLEDKKRSIYASESPALRKGFTVQLFELTNAARVQHGLAPLAWDEPTSDTAFQHSADMALNDYFNHENQEGKSPFDRLKDNGIRFRGAGENLAYGQSSSIFAHEGLMNSAGHRENILLDGYTHLGTGVAFNEKSQPYYTENFLQK